MTAIHLIDRDVVEADLIDIDRDYVGRFGANLETWPRGVRGEYFNVLSSHCRASIETRPTHPRKASARRRRRNSHRLPYLIHQIAPGAATVLLTSLRLDDSPGEATFQALAKDTAGETVRLPEGGSHRIAELLQGAFPAADWTRAQTWHAASNTLNTWRQSINAGSRTGGRS
jgi:hypothetical protein